MLNTQPRHFCCLEMLATSLQLALARHAVAIDGAKERALGALLLGAAGNELNLLAGGKAAQLAKAKALRVGWASLYTDTILNALGPELQRTGLLVVGVVGLWSVVYAMRRVMRVVREALVPNVGRMSGVGVRWMSVCHVYSHRGKRVGAHFRVHHWRLRSSSAWPHTKLSTLCDVV